MTQKNEAKKKYLQVKATVTREIDEAKRTEANRICREKKENRDKQKKNFDK